MTAEEFESGANALIDSTPARGVNGSKGVTKNIFKQIIAFLKQAVLDGLEGPQGPQGNVGAQGPQGPAGTNGHVDTTKIKGFYNPATAYTAGDIVEYWPRTINYYNGEPQEVRGGVFVATASTTGNAPISEIGAPHASWKGLFSSVQFETFDEEEATMVATSQNIQMSYGTKNVIIPANLTIAESTFNIILPSYDEFRNHYSEPSEFFIHNANAKAFLIKGLTGGTVNGYKGENGLLTINGSGVALSYTANSQGIYHVLKLGDPYLLEMAVNKIVTKYPADRVNIRTSFSSTQLYPETRNVQSVNGYVGVQSLVLPKNADNISTYELAPMELLLFNTHGVSDVRLVDHAGALVGGLMIDNFGFLEATSPSGKMVFTVPGVYKLIKGSDLNDWTAFRIVEY